MNSQLLYEKQLANGMFQVYSSRPNFSVKTVKQTHSDIVVNENGADQEADGIWGNSQTPIAVLTADCIPVVLLGKNTHAMIHAGWKGLSNSILNHADLKKMQPTTALIGPHIRVEHYEVQEDFKKNFPETTSFFTKDNQLYFDLTKEVTTQLKKFYPNIEILDCNICTFADENFASYRRNKTPNRNWNIFIPKDY